MPGRASPCYDTEVFGPVASVTSLKMAERATELARDSAYGLSLGILTADVARGLLMADQIPTGVAHVND